MLTPQEASSHLLAQYLKPAMRAKGFVGPSTAWVKGSPDEGWVVVSYGGNRRNTRDVGHWSVIIWGWPPGTWEQQTRDAASKPDARVAPIYAAPEHVVGWPTGPRPRPDEVELTAGMSEDQIAAAARVLLDYTDRACVWVEARHRNG